MLKATTKQIQSLKKRSAAINYRGIAVDKSGKLIQDKKESFAELLDKRIVAGYALTWASVNQHREKFIKGAFAKTIRDNGPNSNATYKIKLIDRHGKAVALMATLEEDEIGLYFRSMPLDEVQWADDLLVQLRSGTINNFSIGFGYVWDKIEYDDENDILIIEEARLFEISAVDVPSDLSSYALRSIDNEEDIEDKIEEFISTLKRSQQLFARRLFSDYKNLLQDEPLEQRRKALKNGKAKRKGKLDYTYIKNNLKI